MRILSKSGRVSFTPISLDIAIRCNTAFVEPPIEFTMVIAFSNDSNVKDILWSDVVL